MFSELENVTDFLFCSKRILLYSSRFKLLFEIKGEPKSNTNSLNGPLLLEITTASHHLALFIFSTEDLGI
jgi:hypothetical protein